MIKLSVDKKISAIEREWLRRLEDYFNTSPAIKAAATELIIFGVTNINMEDIAEEYRTYSGGNDIH